MTTISTQPGLVGAAAFDVTLTGAGAPVEEARRIRALDVIRGFALFGVVWMNLFESTTRMVPARILDGLATAPVDRVVGPFSSWLMQGKAQCLFGILFGFGFAVFSDRVARRRADARALYARRLTVLLLFGSAHFVLLWWGDILHDYALLGFLLFLTSRMSGRVLLALALALLLGSAPLETLIAALGGYDLHAEIVRAHAQLNAAMWRALAAGDYRATVEGAFLRLHLIYDGVRLIGLWGPIAGQFLLGAWLFRHGWLQDVANNRRLFRRAAAVLVPAGLLLTLPGSLTEVVPAFRHLTLPRVAGEIVGEAGTLMLALGYGAVLAALVARGSESAAFTGLAAFGRMALTNYVMQSFVYFFIEYGFGFDLFTSTGVTVDLLLGLAVTVVQIAFSLTWLRYFRFGPLEWAWRSATYGRRQAFRRTDAHGYMTTQDRS